MLKILKQTKSTNYISFEEIHKKWKRHYRNKNELNLKWENCISIKKGTFKNVNTLAYLTFTDPEFHPSEIFSLNSGCFNGLSLLKSIFLGNCGIEIIYEDVFSNLTNLESLYLSENNLKIINSKLFSGLINLKQLHLSDCSIEIIEAHSFDGLNNLLYLDLSLNQIEKFHLNLFGDLKNLLKINLHRFEVKSKESINSFQCLTSLENIISSIKDMNFWVNFLSNKTQENIKKITLFDNFYGTELIDEDFDGDNNQAYFISLNFTYLINLQELILDNNYISIIKNGYFDHLVNLKSISFFACCIEVIENDAFDNLKNLESLDLQENFLDGSNFSILFKNLQNLKYLDLSSNEFKSMNCDFISRLVNLEEFILSSCQINSLNLEAFVNLTGLKTLDLRGNNLNNLTRDDFSFLPNLNKLFL